MSADQLEVDRRLDILHLGFEDHRRPGSGGGGLRTHEINRRLASRGHRVTVLTTRYPGSRPRIEDGVRYRPLGVAAGYYLSIISYHLSVPFVVAASHPDLVVEDFAAPMSSILAPLWTRQPTVALVQWLFASATSTRYRLPFYLVESLGVRVHRRFIAASSYMAGEIRRRNPQAHVEVVYAGVDRCRRPADIVPRSGTPARLLYLGRLQLGPKGLDLLLAAVAAASESADVRLTIAGDGPDRAEIEALAGSLGIRKLVDVVGRVDGDAKWQLLRSSSLVVVPSRYESFGLVAVEALESGTPVVAFDIPSMREILVDGSGVLVPAFDVGRMASAITTLCGDPQRRRALAEAGRARAAMFDWDRSAAEQERLYLGAAAAGPRQTRRWSHGVD